MEVPLILMFTVLIGCVLSERERRGPYDIVFKYMDPCVNEETAWLYTPYWRLTKTGRTSSTLEGKIIINGTIDDSVKVRIKFEKSTPTGWKDNFYVMDFNGQGVCSVAKEWLSPQDWMRILTGLTDGPKNYTDCPVEPGEYNMYFDIRLKPFKAVPEFFYGTYRARLMLFYPDFDHEIYCVYLRGDAVPARRKNG